MSVTFKLQDLASVPSHLITYPTLILPSWKVPFVSPHHQSSSSHNLCPYRPPTPLWSYHILPCITSAIMSVTSLKLDRKVFFFFLVYFLFLHFLEQILPFIFCCCCYCSVTQLCPTVCDLLVQASLSVPTSWSLPKLMSIESVMPSNHLIPCCPLFFLPSIFPSIRVFSNESVLPIRWPKY